MSPNMHSNLSLRAKTISDEPLIQQFMAEHWGGEPIIVNCQGYYPSRLPGFLAFDQSAFLGCLIYEEQEPDWEIIAFDVLEKYQGIGTRLLQAFLDQAARNGCHRVHLMTTNDNIDALRFYQRRGFSLAGIRLGACIAGRRLKPSLPEIGDYGIPIRDEILLEKCLPPPAT